MQDNQPTTPRDTAAPTTEAERVTAPASPPDSQTRPEAEPAPVSAVPVSRRPRGTRLLNIALGGALVLAIAGVAFAVGRFTAPAAVTAGNFPGGGPGGQFFQNGSGQLGPNGGQGGPGAFLAGGGITLEGTVESVTDTTLTLKTASGQTIQIALDGTTTYHAQSDASASDVTTGSKVLVRVDGFRGGPGASPGTGNSAASSQTASDVTVVP